MEKTTGVCGYCGVTMQARLAARFDVPAEDLRIYRLLLLTYEKEPQGSLHKSSSQVN